MSTASVPAQEAAPIPSFYWWWLSTLAVSQTASRALAFGLVWVATEHGAVAAALVLVANSVPRILVSTGSGVVIDRRGAFRIMLAADLCMVAVTAGFALAGGGGLPLAAVLVLVALMGTVEGFYIPASGSVPKVLVHQDHLPRAMAGSQLVNQAASVLSPVLGGLLIISIGVQWALIVAGAGYLLMAGLLLGSRAWTRDSTDPEASRDSFVRSFRQGWQVMTNHPMLRTTVTVTALFMLLMPAVTSFFVPVVTRASGWDADAAGTITACFAGGMVAVAIWVIIRGGCARPGLTVSIGILVLGLSVVAVAGVHHVWWAGIAAVVGGLGASAVSTHLAPLFVAAAPRRFIGRMQSIMTLAQSLPLVVAPLVLGPLAQNVDPRGLLAVWGALIVLLALGTLASATLRGARHG